MKKNYNGFFLVMGLIIGTFLIDKEKVVTLQTNEYVIVTKSFITSLILVYFLMKYLTSKIAIWIYFMILGILNSASVIILYLNFGVIKMFYYTFVFVLFSLFLLYLSNRKIQKVQKLEVLIYFSCFVYALFNFLVYR